MRGGSGMIATRTSDTSHPVTRAFIETAATCGKTEQRDVNAVARVGDAAGQKDINTDAQMRRVSAAHAYLAPALKRENLTLLTDAAVMRLDIERGECRGVFVSVNGETRRIAAAKEVILSAGGLMSPKLLMLSGVGPADHLRTAWHSGRGRSPRIGGNLHDHLLVRLAFSAKSPTPPQTDTGHAGITWHKSNAALPGPTSRFSAGCIRRACRGYNAEAVLRNHGRSDEAEEPRYAAARLGRSVRRLRSSIRTIFPIRPTSMPMSPEWSLVIAIGNGGASTKCGRPRSAFRAVAARRSSSTSAPTPRPIITTSAPARWAPTPARRSTRCCACAASRGFASSTPRSCRRSTCCNTHAPTLALAERAAELAAGAVTDAQRAAEVDRSLTIC